MWGQTGRTFRYFDAVNVITSAPGYAAESDRAIHYPVRDYLWHLHRNGLLDWPNPSHRYIPQDVGLTVVADATTPRAARCQWCQFPTDSVSHLNACGKPKPTQPPITTTPEPPAPASEQPPTPQPPKPADNPYRYQELPDWHADIGLLDHYAPGLRPICGWHVEIFRKHVRSPRRAGLLPHQLAKAYDNRWVTESAVVAALDHFARTGWLQRVRTPHGPISVPADR